MLIVGGEKLGGHEYLTLSLDGELIPWDELPYLDKPEPGKLIGLTVFYSDYDESLAKYQVSPRFHHFFENDNGELSLEHTHYRMPIPKKIVHHNTIKIQ